MASMIGDRGWDTVGLVEVENKGFKLELLLAASDLVSLIIL